jgi:hypothetical protein
VRVRHGLTTYNLVRPNIARNIGSGCVRAHEAGPPTGGPQEQGDVENETRHCWSGMLAIGALVLTACAAMVRAGSSATPNETYRATEVISHVLGSKQAVGYFLTVNGQCALTLMVAEAIDPDGDVPGSAARLRFALRPGEQAALATKKARRWCSSAALELRP